jgi:hypothetical protein
MTPIARSFMPAGAMLVERVSFEIDASNCWSVVAAL